jgi:hypothetical protein
VITATFDIYFHLWNKGTPHWEKEKRAWEIEQEKEWTQVLSKAAKKEARKSQVPKKKVRFAECSDRPAKKHSDPVISLVFGSFETKVDPSNLKPSGSLFRSSQDHSSKSSDECLHVDPPFTAHPAPQISRSVSNSNHSWPSRPVFRPNLGGWFSNGKKCCSRCLSPSHSRRACRSPIRCCVCFRPGHLKRLCSSNQRWIPKAQPPKDKGNLEAQVHDKAHSRE